MSDLFPLGEHWVDKPTGWDLAKLAAVRGIEDGVLWQNGIEAFAWGAPDDPREWASCGRAGSSMTSWMHKCTNDHALRASLDQPINALGTPTALTFQEHERLCDVLAYIQPNGRWAYSYGWKQMDDVFFERVGQKLHDYFNAEIAPRLHGNLTARENSADGTPRIVGSARDAVQWAIMMLRNGDGLIAPDLVRRVLGGGPDGNGTPYSLEGMQVHLIKEERAWEDPDELILPGVPDGFAARDGDEAQDHGHGFIGGFPTCQVAFAYRGASCDRVLPQVFEAML